MSRFNPLLIIAIFAAVLILQYLQNHPLETRRYDPNAKLKERDYQQIFCGQVRGTVDAHLSDGTECDCLTGEHAIEVEFSQKWYEAIGQSLHYGKLTRRPAGIALIMREADDEKYFRRMMETIEYYHLPITVWRQDGIETLLVKPKKI